MNTIRALTPEQAQAIRSKRVQMMNDPNVSDEEMAIFYASEDWRSQQAYTESFFAALDPRYTPYGPQA